MAHIKFDSVTVRYPIYNAGAMSLKKKLVNVGTGGRFSEDIDHVVTVTALDNVSFSLSDGDAVGLIGHNGAGKTTLLRTMAGIYTPVAGSVSRLGKVSTIIELGAGLDSELSGYENIYRMGLLLGMSKSVVQELIPSIEAFTELGDFLEAPVRTYSSGMLMRLMFAVNTANKPEILLVDEMFGTGDKGFQEKAKARMEDIISSAKIFVFASHSEELIKKFCNRIFEIKHGFVQEIS
jgi:ABC-type polysaccharide/polyol phosphate transport system ATPase subunit